MTQVATKTSSPAMTITDANADAAQRSTDSVGGEVVVITGASSGIGLETAKQLATQGAEIVMVARDRTRGEQARTQVAQVGTGKPPVLMLADLSVQAQVRHVADEIKARYDRIDILINNAGSAFNTRQESADGVELTWATNHLAAFVLTDRLLPALIAAQAGRIVNLTTEIYSRKLDLDDLQGERKYSWMSAYRISKLGTVLFTKELARRIEGSGVTAVSISPGPAKTNFGGGGPSGLIGVVATILKHTPLLKQPDQAAESIVWAATAPELKANPGAVYLRHKRLTLKGAATDPSLAGQALDHQRTPDGNRPQTLKRRGGIRRELSEKPASTGTARARTADSHSGLHGAGVAE
jgi:NAD(P)-dependent dehydrogenase (short-subunit alcohol dehydrogenase family)